MLSFVFVNSQKIKVLNRKNLKRLQAASCCFTFAITKILSMLMFKLGIGNYNIV